MRRRVLLHMGLGKTGSTALQVAFVRNRERLAAQGVHYTPHDTDRRAAAGRSTSGNGKALLPFLVPRPEDTAEASDQALAQVLDLVRTTSEPTMLFSSEFLYGFRPDRLAELKSRLAEHDVDLWAFLYVRDIAGLTVSSYAQIVKRRRYRGSMSDYIRTHHLSLPPERSVAGRLRGLHDVLTPEHVVIRHYDTDRSCLFERMATEVLGLDDLTGFDNVQTPVNRSLTPLEIEWTRHINASITDEDASRLAVDLFTHRDALDTPPPAILRTDLDLLRERFQDDVDWINAHGGMEATLSVEGATPVVDDHDVPDISDRERFLLDVIGDFTRAQAERRRAQQARKERQAAKKRQAAQKPPQRVAPAPGPVAAARRLASRVRARLRTGG